MMPTSHLRINNFLEDDQRKAVPGPGAASIAINSSLKKPLVLSNQRTSQTTTNNNRPRVSSNYRKE